MQLDGRVRLLVLIAATASACINGPPLGGQEGKLGRIQFHWPGAPAAQFASGGVQVPMKLQLLSQSTTWQSVASTHLEVASFARPANPSFGDLLATTGATGTTELQVRDAMGQLVDSLDVTVADAASVDLTPGWMGDGPSVSGGWTWTLHATPRASDGAALSGWYVTSLQLGQWLVEEPSSEMIDIPTTEYAFYSQADHGDSQLTVSAGKAQAPIAVHVIPDQQIDAVQVKLVTSWGTYYNVAATASSRGVAVYGKQCDWSSSPPVTHRYDDFERDLSKPAATTTRFILSDSGQYTVACTINGVRGELQLVK